MRAVIICGGAIRDYDFIKNEIKSSDIIICADSGYNHAIKMGLDVKVVVGDFDSIGNIPTNIKTVKFPTNKDKTDTELAIDYARGLNLKNFLLIAGIGSRMDHSLANILMLTQFLNNNEYAEIINENNRIMITNSKLDLNGYKGETVSLLPLCNCFNVTTTNLKYPLNNAKMYLGKGLGVSNIILKNSACISVGEGTLLVIISKD